MIMSIAFTLQIIALAVGLGLGYFLLVNAPLHDERLRNVGEGIGWAIIAATIILTIYNCIYSISYANKKEYSPVNNMAPQQQQTGPMLQQDQQGASRGVEQPTTPQNDVESETDTKPVTRSIEDTP